MGREAAPLAGGERTLCATTAAPRQLFPRACFAGDGVGDIGDDGCSGGGCLAGQDAVG